MPGLAAVEVDDCRNLKGSNTATPPVPVHRLASATTWLGGAVIGGLSATERIIGGLALAAVVVLMVVGLTRPNPARGTLFVNTAVGVGAIAVAYTGLRRVKVAERQVQASADSAAAAVQSSEAAVAQADVSRAAMVTDAFARAVEQLSDTSAQSRLGGLHTLERIAHGDPEDSVVVAIAQLISGTVRIWSPRRSAPTPVPMHAHDPNPELLRPAPEVLAAVRILGRLPGKAWGHVDLSDVHLVGAKLNDLCLRGVRLDRSDLTATDLYSTDLAGARMRRTILSAAVLTKTDLTGAKLHHTVLYRARLNEAVVSLSTELFGVDIRDMVSKKVDWPIVNDGRGLPRP